MSTIHIDYSGCRSAHDQETIRARYKLWIDNDNKFPDNESIIKQIWVNFYAPTPYSIITTTNGKIHVDTF
jgi:hypothetical protein